MKIEILLGKTIDHLVPLEGTHFFLHQMVIQDFLLLKEDAKEHGFDLKIASAFRSYDRQQKIWNAKASGERQLVDDLERPLTFSQLSPLEIMFAILRWSALPGCSRHHWGTDFDIYDGNTQNEKEVKLVPSETLGEGPSAKLHDWLDFKISTNSAHGFFRPYATDLGGFAPERWHLSYYPISSKCFEAYHFGIFKNNIESSSIVLKDFVLEHAEEIYHRFFLNIDQP